MIVRPGRGRYRSGWWLTGSTLTAVALAWWASLLVPPLSAGMRAELQARGRIAVWGSEASLRLRPANTVLTRARDHAALLEALHGKDAAALAQAMDAEGLRGLLVAARDPARIEPAAGVDGESVLDRLTRLDYVRGMQARYLTPEASLYLRDDVVEIDAVHAQALATVARGIVGGAQPPRVTSCPEPLRRVRSVEVMVLLEGNGRPKLWRSARGSSIARALVTAAVVARRRWMERERAMGSDIDDILPTLDVEISLLREDGTLGARKHDFIERVFTPMHGVAYEGKGAWRYLLPRATREAGGGSALRAYEKLLADHALPGSSLSRMDLRLYRMVMLPLARSPAVTPQPG